MMEEGEAKKKREPLAPFKVSDRSDDNDRLPFQIATDIYCSQQRWHIYPYLAGDTMCWSLYNKPLA